MASLSNKKVLLFLSLLMAAQMALGPSVAFSAPPASSSIVHVVQAGENLFRISLRYDTTVNAIMQVNSLTGTTIYVGQRLVIPGSYVPPSGPSFTYTVKRGDTLYAIAWRFGTTVAAMARLNGLVNPSYIYVGQRLQIPGAQPAPSPVSCGVWYTIQPGDTVSALALRYGTTVWAIVSANNLTNANYIYAGQRLFISCRTVVVPPSANNCSHITSPTHGSKVSGKVTVHGTAQVDNFWYYKFEYRRDDGQQNWITYDDLKYTPVEDGKLGKWDLKALHLPKGWYWFRVVIVDQTGNYPPPCEMHLYVQADS